MASLEETAQESTREIAAFVSELEYDDVPTEAIPLVERAFVDTVGVTLAGSCENAGTIAAEAVGLTGGGGPSRIAGLDASASPAEAAFVNGVAAHALDFDDYTFVPVHPSAPIVPALFAVADSTPEPVDGRSAVAAYVAGFETICYLAEPIGAEHQEHGWHSTGTLGAFGAAAAASSVLDLDPPRVETALNVVASMAAGLMQNSGSMTKPLHAGQAARSGVTAALLAAGGFTADEHAITGPQGFFQLFKGQKDPALDDLPTPGRDWALVEKSIGFKKYPACAMLQSGIEAASILADEESIDPDRVDSIQVEASQNSKNVCHYGVPRTGLEAKFSMPYAVAVGLLRERVGLADFDEDLSPDAATEQLCELTTFEVDPDLPYLSTETTVSISLDDGRRVERTVEYHPGHPENRMSDDEIREKFVMCARRALPAETAVGVYARLHSLREQSSVTDVFE